MPMLSANQKEVIAEALSQLETAHAVHRDAERTFREAVHYAAQCGATLRSIASITGQSHETIRRWFYSQGSQHDKSSS